MVLKYLHHSTDIQDIRQELLEVGHVARNIVNVHHRQTKEPLNLFFVDLEPANNNKDIYNITAIQNKIILIEPPRVNKKHVPRCVRCQQYGHTRTSVINPTRVSNAEGPTTVQIAPSKWIRQRNVYCVAETTQLTTKAVNTIITLSKATTHTETNQKSQFHHLQPHTITPRLSPTPHNNNVRGASRK